MKKAFKKVVSLMLVAMMFSGIAMTGVTAFAAESFTENGFIYAVIDETATITGYEDTLTGDVVIPETLGGYPVTAVGKEAFKFCTMTSLYIPAGVTSIDGYPYINHYGALYGCSDLEKITVDKNNPVYSNDEYGVLFTQTEEGRFLSLFPQECKAYNYVVPDDVEEIDCYAFYNCDTIRSVDTGYSARRIGLNTFFACDNLVQVTFGDGMEIIGTDAFSSCDKLRNVTFSDGVSEIHTHAFENCDGLKELNLPRGLTHFDDLALFGCSSIEKITVDPRCENFESDEHGVLYGAGKTELVKFPPASKLTSYDVPDSVTYIRGFAFGFEAKNIEKVTIGSGVELVGSLAFSDCESLEEVVFENGTKPLTFYNEVFTYCERLRNVVLPDNLTTVRYNDIFDGCTALESVTVGTGLTQVKFLSSPKREGCSFLGWYVNGEKFGSPYEKGSERVTFVAQYDPMKYAVTLDGEGGVFDNKKNQVFTSFAQGEEITGLSVPVKDGFVFDGWDGMPENGTMPAESITLKAKWAADEASDKSLSIRLQTCYFNEETKEWTPTTGVAEEEALKLRIYIDTNYYTGGGKFLIFYPDQKFGDNYEVGKTYPLGFNTASGSSAAETGATGTFTVLDPEDPMIKELADGGYIEENNVGDYWALLAEFSFSDYLPKCKKISGDDWFAEIDFKMMYNRLGAYEEFRIYDSTVCSPENPNGYIDVSVGTENGKVFDAASMSEVKVNTTTEKAVCNGQICCSFLAGEGRFKEGTWNFHVFNRIGGKVKVPNDPTREGYTFAGWGDKNFMPVEVPEFTPRDSVAFYAIWVPNDYNAAFYLANGGALYDAKTVVFGEIIEAPEPPVLEGMIFKGWSDAEGRLLDSGYTMPADGVDFFAVWETAKYTVTYNIGKEKEEFTVDFNASVPQPDMSAYSGAELLGWLNADGNEVSIPATMPSKNLEFTAKLRYVSRSEAFDVTATYDEDCFSEDASLSIKEVGGVNEAGGIYMPKDEIYTPLGFFNIKMVNGEDKPVQPNNGKKVKLRFPIPAGYTDRDEYLITHWFTGGGREQFSNVDKGPKIGKAVIENGYIIIEVGQFSEFAIHVKSRASVTKLPSKTSYYYRENINLSGIELEVMAADGTVEKVTDTSKMTVSGYDYSKVGTQTVTVEYEGSKVSFDVEVSYAWWQWIIRILFLGIFWY